MLESSTLVEVVIYRDKFVYSHSTIALYRHTEQAGVINCANNSSDEIVVNLWKMNV